MVLPGIPTRPHTQAQTMVISSHVKEGELLPVGTAFVSVPGSSLEHRHFNYLSNQCPAEAYLRSLSPGESERSMSSALSNIAIYCGYEHFSDVPWANFTADHINQVLRVMSLTKSQIRESKYSQAYEHVKNHRRAGWEWKPVSPASARRYLSAIKGVARQAFLLGQMEEQTYRRVTLIRAPRGSRTRKNLSFSVDDVLAMMNERLTEGTAQGARDAAVLALLYGCGLRRSEATTLTLDGVDFGAAQVTCIGKGNKERSVPMAPKVADILALWLGYRGGDPGALILPIDRLGRIRRKYHAWGELKSGSANLIYRITDRVFQTAGLGHVAPPRSAADIRHRPIEGRRSDR